MTIGLDLQAADQPHEPIRDISTVSLLRELSRRGSLMDFEQFYAELNLRWDLRLRNSNDDYSIPAMGLMGEAGEVGEFFKKKVRDGRLIEGDPALALELGDVLHYWCRLCRLSGFTPEQVMRMNQDKIAKRVAAGKVNI